MNILSLFDGCGVSRLALENLKVPVEKYLASEIDPYCIQITKQRFPDVIQIGDVCNIDQEVLSRHFTGPIDLLIGGSPCQNLSCSGKREGLQGEKSVLFYEYVRILKLVKPRYFLLENVASMKQVDKDLISFHLQTEPILLNSNQFTAQNRKRYYWTNIPISTEEIVDKQVFLSQLVPHKEYVYCVASRGRYVKGTKTVHQNLEKRTDGKTNTLTSVLKDNYVMVDGSLRSLTIQEYEALQGLPMDYTSAVSITKRYKIVANAFTCPVIEFILYKIDQ